jgi:7,8-dihydropterin-6-yl-methyl-4-(beta-D-ribofuranosyl)aminobenzene 5'-phosphate synthase
MKVTILYDNDSYNSKLVSAWGFSCLIELDDSTKLMFDTGGDGGILLGNMRVLGVKPGEIESVVLSHLHGDHTGGLKRLLEANPKIKVFAPAGFRDKSAIKNFEAIDGAIEIYGGVFSTGVLMGIEQSLVIKTSKGILVIVGCSHPGVENILDVAEKYGSVYGIIGGFHGFSDFKRLKDLSLIAPCHCTRYKKEIKHIYRDKCSDCSVGKNFSI